MQLWFARKTAVTIREQLTTQIVLGILCGDLASGQRLPSIRDLARRFRLHPNTVSAGYRQLERDHWVEFRRGSGVYVRDRKRDAPLPPAIALDHSIANLFRSARELGIPLADVRSRLLQWLGSQPPDHFLLIETDEELRQIVALEMQQAVALPVRTCGLRDLSAVLEGAIPVALPRHAAIVRQALPAATDLITLRYRSVPSSLAGWLPTPSTALVGIASRWPDFLKLARTILLAAGFHKDSLVFRDARKPNWHRGLKQTAAVICDSVTAAALPKPSRAITFLLISDSSLTELKQYQGFIRNPLASSL
ncbi:MAG: GntR family transcriptional regulator [Candidatus Acidiferrales bacterium]